jgi:uncharacterized protein YdeI (YjbR/CyaY-like superfamily)
MSKTARNSKTFTAELYHAGSKLAWTVVRIPFEVAKVWGTRGHLRVKGEISGSASARAGFPFRTSLFPDGKGAHFMMVNKKMQAGAGVTIGQTARFRMEPDTEERVVAVPAELTRVLKSYKRLQKFFDSLSYSMRNDLARRVSEAKHAETRRRRADQMAELLMQTMDAERELPPLMARALAADPQARQGWERMPPSHRRHNLMGIFYYRQPESRARRLGKALEMAREYAEKKANRAVKTKGLKPIAKSQ